MKNARLTRRQWAGLLAAAPAALAQTEPAPAELLKTAKEEAGKRARELAKHKIPAGTEPAFSFRVL